MGWREPGRESGPAARDPRRSAADARTGGRRRRSKLGFGDFCGLAESGEEEDVKDAKLPCANRASRFGFGARGTTGRDSLMDSARRSKSFFIYYLFIDFSKIYTAKIFYRSGLLSSVQR